MKANYLPHLAGRVFGVPLLIQPQKLSVILQAIGPRLGLPPGEFEIEGLGVPVVARVTQGPLDEGDDPDEMDDAARSQKPYLVTPEGVAILGVSGTLVKKASWLDAASGMQSYECIRADFQDAVRDPRIQGILLDVDSPGGEVGGLFDLADENHHDTNDTGTRPDPLGEPGAHDSGDQGRRDGYHDVVPRQARTHPPQPDHRGAGVPDHRGIGAGDRRPPLDAGGNPRLP